MTAGEWHRRWAEGRLGWHRDQVSSELTHHAPTWLEPGGRVLVPLCGKTVDIRWLLERGHPVVGVELVESGIAALLSESGLEATPRDEPPFRVYRGAGGLEIYHGDMFELTPERARADEHPIAHVWDRAAMIALPPAEREAYARVLRVLAPAATMLLVTLEYDQSAMEGPPFSVPEDEVRRLFAGGRVELASRGPAAMPPRSGDAGPIAFDTATYRIELSLPS